ncbi:MAG: LacI family DNA-binding transcriptional regulator, partial [Bacteroidota bacterium]
MSATIRDVAHRAGVSISTVSRLWSNSEKNSPLTNGSSTPRLLVCIPNASACWRQPRRWAMRRTRPPVHSLV